MESEDKVFGLYTSFTSMTPILLTSDFTKQLILVCIAGLFGVVSSLAVAGFKHLLRDRRQSRRGDTFE